MAMSADHIERMFTIRDMRNAGLTFKEIGEQFGISLSRARQIYEKAIRIEWRETAKTEFQGLDWIPAFGFVREGITTREKLETLHDDVILYILNKYYSGTTEKPRTDLLKNVRVYLGREEA